MLILNSSFLGADFAFSPTPTKINPIIDIEVSNAKFDTVAVTKNIDKELTYIVDTSWNEDTIMSATYNNNLNAGNIDYAVENTSDIVIKRRLKGTHNWTTIYHKSIKTKEDFNFAFPDYFTSGGKKQYEYAVVGMLNGVETTYNVVDVESNFDGMFIIGQNSVYGTELDVGYCDTDRVHYISKQELPSFKFPNTYSFSKTNYDTGTAEGCFIKCEEENDNFLIDDSSDYRHDVIDFLSDNQPKVLKTADGRMWMIGIDGNISDRADGHNLHRLISFSWYECGNCDRERDLYDAGLSDISEEYWSNS